MKIGNINISNLKLGTVQIKKVFSGLDLVWTSFLSIINDFKSRVLGNQGQFEAETCLNNTLEDMGIDLFEQASLVITPNGYKENVLYSVTPSPVGTNLYLYSEDFTQSNWGKINYTIVPNTINSPNGTLTADTLRIGVDASSVRHRFYQSIALSGVLTTTYYLKKAQHSWIQLNYVTSVDLNDWANFDLENGVIGNTGVGAVASIEDVGDGWYRCRLEGTGGGSSTNCEIISTNNTNSGRYPPYQSTTAEDVCYVWGAQLEYGATAGPYIPTTTRQAINETICDFTVTRATTATRVNSDGLIEVVPYNIFTMSTRFELSNWIKNLITISSTYSIAPNSLLEARTVQTGVDASANRHRLIQQFTSTVIGGNTYTFSIYAKKNQHSWIQVNFTSNFSVNDWANFDLENGVIGNTGTGAIASIEDVGDGWYRLWITGTAITTGAATNAEILVINNTNSVRYPSYQSLVAEDVFDIWGAQLVQGTEPKTYYPTTNRLNIPRIDYSNGSCPSILVEPQRTNLLVRSEEFENASWGKNNSSIIPNVIISPSGLMNADKLVENNLLAHHNIQVFTGGTELRTNSIFVKAGERSRFILWAGASGYMFDLINLTTTPGNNSSSITSTSIQDYGNGWYRCSITSDAGPNNGYTISLLDNETNPVTPSPQYQGDGVSGLYIWGAQRENASSLTSYIPTTTATVTRNADVISNVNAIDLIGQTEGTIFVDYNKVLANDTARNIISLSDTTAINAIEIWDGVGSVNLGRIIYTYFTNNIIKSSGFGQSTASPSGRYKICVTYLITPALVNFKIFINGVKLDDRNFTYTAFSNPLSRINIGNRNGIGVGVGSHNLDFILKTRISDTEAINLTTL